MGEDAWHGVTLKKTNKKGGKGGKLTSTKLWIASMYARLLSLMSTHRQKKSPAYLLYTILKVRN